MQKFLNACAEVEEAIGQIYREYEKLSQGEEVLEQIWRDMARDEDAHAQQLRLAMRLPVKTAFAGIKEGAPDLDELRRVAAEALVEARTGKMKLLEMLKTAVSLENNFRGIHAGCALLFKDPSLQKTFKALARADQEHLAALDAYLKGFKKKHAPNE